MISDNDAGSVPISLRIPKGLYQHLKRLARREAVLRDADVLMSDLVRHALVEVYPLPEPSKADEQQT